MLQVIITCVLIFMARLTDVSMLTIRTLMLMRGKRFYAAFIGFFEVIIYISALSRVVNSLDNPLNLIAYALGFASGNYLGSYLEEKMALGNIFAQIIFNKNGTEMVDYLREEGFGVTTIDGMGKAGLKKVLFISLERRNLPRLLDITKKLDETSFITVMDARTTRGGYFRQRSKAK